MCYKVENYCIFIINLMCAVENKNTDAKEKEISTRVKFWGKKRIFKKLGRTKNSCDFAKVEKARHIGVWRTQMKICL